MKILILSGIGANNIGDDAMLIGCVNDLQEVFPQAELVISVEDETSPLVHSVTEPLNRQIVRSFNKSFVSLGRLNSIIRWMPASLKPTAEVILFAIRIYWWIFSIRCSLPTPFCLKYRETIAHWRQADIVFDVGGANLNEIWKNYFYEKVFSFLLAGALKKRLVLSGQSMERINSRLDRLLLRRALNNASIITTREEISREYALSVGVKEEKIHTTGDDALSLLPVSQNRARERLAEEGIDEMAPLIGFQFRNYLELNNEVMHRKIAEVLDLVLERTGYRILHISMHYGAGDERDHLVAITRFMRHSERVIPLKGQYTPSEILGLTGEMFMNVGISYHFYIFSAMMGVPNLALYVGEHYRQKMHGLSKLYEMEDAIHSLEVETADDFLAKFEGIMEVRERVQEHIRKRNSSLRDRVKDTRESLRSLV